ncbi:MAG: hypothetical protein J6I97_04730 [Agathobacter sp.]|nr:hypothetical protein [Agathobacter sp.]
MIYFIVAVIVYILHVLLKLNWYMTAVLMLYALFMIPKHTKRHQRTLENQERFFEVSSYLDTLLYSFVKEEKVVLAISDVSQTLPKGKMKHLVEKAFDYMQMTFDEIEVLREALGMIEKEYPCQRIRDVHQFMLHVEYYGGEIEKPVNLLLADKGRWERRIKETMAQRKKQFVDVVLSVVASLLICGAIVYLPVMNMDISGQWFVQIFTVLVIVVNDCIILRAQKFLMADWITLQLTEEEEYYVKKMQEFHNYAESKEKKLSMVLGVLGSALTIVLWFEGNEWLVVAGLLLTLFFFNQHRIGKNLLRKSLIKEIKYAFPNWLLDIVLLLQSENVQVALQKSREHVPGVLKEELYQLTDRLELQPESSEPYHLFLKEFEIPEVHSAMGILYSLSIGNSGNADKQISELVEKNLELLDGTERELLHNSSSGMYLLFLLPVVVASFKLIVDMLFMMLAFIQVPVV